MYVAWWKAPGENDVAFVICLKGLQAKAVKTEVWLSRLLFYALLLGKSSFGFSSPTISIYYCTFASQFTRFGILEK